jgi:membrane-bound serine protease (ClpP class)
MSKNFRRPITRLSSTASGPVSRFRFPLFISLIIIVSPVVLSLSTVLSRSQRQVFIAPVSGTVSPGLAGYIATCVEKAAKQEAECLVIQLDTPGGLAESMRSIIKTILSSPVPVIVYVAPSGARAASAGVMITLAADIAAMAPGTNIGAAHPVNLGQKGMDETMADKVVNDMVAYVKSIAERRGRNTEWPEQAVRESASITEKEALELNVIDLVADDLDGLLRQIDGWRLDEGDTLSTIGAEQVILAEGLRDKVLKILSDPNIAYLLMMIGLAGLYFELSHPGAIFPGVVGAMSLILAFFAFQTLPVNYAGILLILLGLVLFILEMKIASYGLLSLGGIVSLFLGSLMLFEGDRGGMDLAWSVFLPTVIMVSGFFVVVAALVFRAQVSRPRSGDMGIIGEVGVVKQAISLEGKVFVHGELWKAVADVPIAEGTKVQVTGIEGLVLKVERLKA